METARLPNEATKGSKTSLVPLEYVQEIRGRIDHRGQEADDAVLEYYWKDLYKYSK